LVHSRKIRLSPREKNRLGISENKQLKRIFLNTREIRTNVKNECSALLPCILDVLASKLGWDTGKFD
jgi:hypothetical protein